VALADYQCADPLLELSSSPSIRTSVLAGVGPAVLSSRAVADEIESGRLRQFPVRDLDLPLPHRTNSHLEHAPLPANRIELHCSTPIFGAPPCVPTG
jgi:DNA-binding transcriptional LysR family regulator